jgi:hypothetical protein
VTINFPLLFKNTSFFFSFKLTKPLNQELCAQIELITHSDIYYLCLSPHILLPVFCFLPHYFSAFF